MNVPQETPKVAADVRALVVRHLAAALAAEWRRLQTGSESEPVSVTGDRDRAQAPQVGTTTETVA